MAIKRSFFTSFVVVIAFIACLFPSAFTVKADSSGLDDYVKALDDGYARVNEFISSEGDNGILTEANVGEILTATSNAVEAAELLKQSVTSEEYGRTYRNKHTDVLQVCKNAHVWLLDNGYILETSEYIDFSIYAPTTGGIILVNSKRNEFANKIKLSNYLVEIKSAYADWVAFIGSDEPALKVNSIVSSDGVNVKLEAESKIFAEDDVVEISKFINTVIIKNTQLALDESDKLLAEDSGIAYFLSLRWKSSGVVVEGDKVPNAPVKVTINLSDLGLENATDIQLVRYKGLGEVEFVDGVEVKDGYLTFTLQTFGTDIESEYALDFAVVAKGYKQDDKPIHLYVLIGAGALVLLIIIFQMIRGVKKRRRKKDYKKFVKQRKSERKNKKNKTIEE